jgi:hypothetical protein
VETDSNHRFDRRNIIKGALTVPLLLPSLQNYGERLPRTESTVEKIQRFETAMGDKPMTFEDAKAYAPLVIDLFHQTTGSISSPDELKSNIFFTYAEDNFFDCEMISGDVMAQLQSNYPEIEFTEEFSRQDVNTRPGITIDSGQMFINLAAINNIDSGTTTAFVYDKQRVTEVSSSPVMRFRNIMMHEMFHLNAVLAGEKEVEPDLEILVQRSTVYTIQDSDKQGFRIEFRGYNTEEISGYDVFNEFVTDYMTHELAKNNSLSALKTIYSNYETQSNFNYILDQCSISYSQLLQLYEQADILEFLTLFANGAAKNSADNTPISLPLAFDTTIGQNDLHIDWEKFYNFFPEVITDPYTFDNTKIPEKSCLVVIPVLQKNKKE